MIFTSEPGRALAAGRASASAAAAGGLVGFAGAALVGATVAET
jgi:hypothetical protein